MHQKRLAFQGKSLETVKIAGSAHCVQQVSITVNTGKNQMTERTHALKLLV
jgi:hypothetical protein